MSTAATASATPSIQITPVDPRLESDHWLNLDNDSFDKVARCTSLISLSQTSKKARTKFYRSEY